MAAATTDTRATGREGTPMVSTFIAICPCCGEEVTATDAGFYSCTISVAACSRRRAAGIVSVTVRKTDGYAMAKPVVEATWRHRDGLVSFSPA